MTLIIGVTIEMLLIGFHLFMVLFAKHADHQSASLELRGGVGLFVVASVLFSVAVGWFSTEIAMKKMGLIYESGFFAGLLSFLHAITVLFLALRWLIYLIGLGLVFTLFYALLR